MLSWLLYRQTPFNHYVIVSCYLVHTHTLTHSFSFALTEPTSSLQAGATRQLAGGPSLKAEGGLGQQVFRSVLWLTSSWICMFPWNLTNLQPSTKPALMDPIRRLFQNVGKQFLCLPLLPLPVCLLSADLPHLRLPPLVSLPVLRHAGSLGTSFYSRRCYLGWTGGRLWDESQFPHGPRY